MREPRNTFKRILDVIEDKLLPGTSDDDTWAILRGQADALREKLGMERVGSGPSYDLKPEAHQRLLLMYSAGFSNGRTWCAVIADTGPKE